MDIKNAMPCPRCGGKAEIVKDPVYYGRRYCTCGNSFCEWYRFCPDRFSAQSDAWAVARWNANRMKVMEEEG